MAEDDKKPAVPEQKKPDTLDDSADLDAALSELKKDIDDIKQQDWKQGDPETGQ